MGLRDRDALALTISSGVGPSETASQNVRRPTDSLRRMPAWYAARISVLAMSVRVPVSSV
jgi:hypothetical protein